MPDITARVGPEATNNPEDVRIVQGLLARHAQWLDNNPAPELTGVFNERTARAITGFQKDGGALLAPDGRVDRGGYTIRRLNLVSIAGPQHRVFNNVCWAHGGGLTDADFEAAALALNCEVAAIRAVAQVETKRSPWDEMGRPSILFERHYFARLSGNIYNRTHPDISNTSQGGYGRYSAQYPKLRRAAMLDEAAALKSASWGSFQIMGANHAAAGFSSIDTFVSAMLESEQRHLNAFVAFIQANATLLRALRAKNWATFAAGYNGPGYRQNRYDEQMRDAYDALAPAPPARRQPQPAGAPR